MAQHLVNVRFKYKKPSSNGGGTGTSTLSLSLQGKSESLIMEQLKKRYGQDATIEILEIKWR